MNNSSKSISEIEFDEMCERWINNEIKHRISLALSIAGSLASALGIRRFVVNLTCSVQLGRVEF